MLNHLRRFHGSTAIKILYGLIALSFVWWGVGSFGASVDTIEGISDSGAIADLQDAFQRRNALQCGFCTPGMLIGAQDLLARGGVPSRDAIREHISGNYCRCTGYQAIVDAIESIALVRAGKAG